VVQKKNKNFLQSRRWRKIIGRLRKAIGITHVQDIAHEYGLHTFRLDLVLLGRKGLTVENLIRTCNAFNLSPNWVLFGKGRPELIRKPGSLENKKGLRREIRTIIQNVQAPEKRDQLEEEILKLLERLTEQ